MRWWESALQAVGGQDSAGARPAVIWFRQDLRLVDQAAVREAALGGRAVVAVYVLDDEAAGPWAMGGASRWWLHHSLVSLGDALAEHGVQLVLRRGRTTEILARLMAETGAAEVHAGRMHEPWGRVLEAALMDALPNGALRLHRTATLFDLEPIRTKTGGIYGMYTAVCADVAGAGRAAASRTDAVADRSYGGRVGCAGKLGVAADPSRLGGRIPCHVAAG